MTADAQAQLADKKSQTVDLGYGVETSEYLTTAATYTITAEELSRTSAISLADALYGKLLGLTAVQNTGFKGEEGRVRKWRTRCRLVSCGNMCPHSLDGAFNFKSENSAALSAHSNVGDVARAVWQYLLVCGLHVGVRAEYYVDLAVICVCDRVFFARSLCVNVKNGKIVSSCLVFECLVNIRKGGVERWLDINVSHRGNYENSVSVRIKNCVASSGS